MLQNRPPIIVILGHVDHGKTTLLDALRKTDVAAHEVGGITQGTRAFQIETEFKMTFIDTPGHSAFSEMRSRGGRIADIALLVVSAVDGVMPQTKESIASVKSIGIPLIVVITKMDLPGASSDKIKTQLAESGLVLEDYGGNVPVVPISAKTGTGLTELLEMINLVSSLQPPQADPRAPLEAIVLESGLHSQKGPLATVIVKNGTLEVGQPLYLGSDRIGKVRALASTASTDQLSTILPSAPAVILGLSLVPPVGSILSSQPTSHSLSKVSSPAPKSGSVNLILKTDTVGSAEALVASLPAEINLISSSTGDLAESDVLSARSTGSHLLGFNVKLPASVAKLAEIDKVSVRVFNIIYELLDFVDKLIRPQTVEVITGRAQIVAEFKIEGIRIAGCKCTAGQIRKSDTLKVGDKTAKVKSLKTGKTEIDLVKSGQEFGVVFSPHIDFKVGDSIMAIQIHDG